MKKPTGELYADAKGLIFLPYNTGIDTKDHVLQVYSSECKKIGGDNLVTYGKALVSTALISTSEFLTWAGNLIHEKKEDAKETIHDKTNNN